MTNNCSILIVGIDQWEQYTLPLIKSIEKHEPEVNIVVVDNASQTPYPKEARIVRSDERLSYAEAINKAAAYTDANWLLSINNDVICQGKFTHLLGTLTERAIYARQLITENGIVWFGNWLVLIPRAVWEVVGTFDKDFEMCGFEDADYAIRAARFGIPVKFLNLPFFHYWGQTRWMLKDYAQKRIKNIEYLERKHGIRLGNDMRVLSE